MTACADRVVVLRDGRLVGRLAKDEITPAAMIRLMIGRDLKSIYRPPAAPPGEPLLEIAGRAHRDLPRAARSTSRVRRGEILGLAGLIGAGRTELARAVFGIDPLLGGSVRLDGAAGRRSPRRATRSRSGIYLVPEDRKASGVVLDLPIAENISLPQLRGLARVGLVDRGAETELAEAERRRLGIRAPDVATPVGSLSGGNQQKVVLAKWLAMQPARDHLRRADPRHRRRRQARDLRPDARRSPTRASRS